MSDHQYRLRRPDFLGGKRASRGELVVPNPEVTLFSAHQVDIASSLPAVVHGYPVLAKLGVARLLANSLSHVIRVGIADPRTAVPGEPDIIRHVSRDDAGALAQLEGVGPDQGIGKPLDHVAVHSLNDGDYGNQEGDTDEHANEGEKTLELLCANGAERHSYGVQQAH